MANIDAYLSAYQRFLNADKEKERLANEPKTPGEYANFYYEPPKSLEVLKNFALPAMGVLEAVLTKGKSPGTAAMSSMKNIAGVEKGMYDRNRQAYIDALSNKTLKRKEDVERGKEARLATYRQRLSEIRDDPQYKNDTERADARNKANLNYIAENDPGKFFSVGAQRPSAKLTYLQKLFLKEEYDIRKEDRAEKKVVAKEQRKIKAAKKAKREEVTALVTGIRSLSGLYKELNKYGLTGVVGGLLAELEPGSKRSRVLSPKKRALGARWTTAKRMLGQRIARLIEKGRLSDNDRDFYATVVGNAKEDPEAFFAQQAELENRVMQSLRGVTKDKPVPYGFNSKGENYMATLDSSDSGTWYQQEDGSVLYYLGNGMWSTTDLLGPSSEEYLKSIFTGNDTTTKAGITPVKKVQPQKTVNPQQLKQLQGKYDY